MKRNNKFSTRGSWLVLLLCLAVLAGRGSFSGTAFAYPMSGEASASVTHDGGFGGPINSTGLVPLSFDPSPPIQYTSTIYGASPNRSDLAVGSSYYFNPYKASVKLAKGSFISQSAPNAHGEAVAEAQWSARFRVDNWSYLRGGYRLSVHSQIPVGGYATGDLDLYFSGYLTRPLSGGGTERLDIYNNITLGGTYTWSTPGSFVDLFQEYVPLPDISLFGPYDKGYVEFGGSLRVAVKNDESPISFTYELQDAGPSPIPVPDVSPGWDLFETTPSTVIGGMHWEGVPLGSFDFGGSIGVENTGKIDTILERKALAAVLGSPETAVAIDIELVALQLKSVDPIDLGAGLDFHYITLDPSNPATGQMTITFDNPNSGTFDSFIDLDYDIHIGAIDGPVISSDTTRLTATGVPWDHTAPPRALLIDGVNRLLNGIDESTDFWPSAPFIAEDLTGNHHEVNMGTIAPGDANRDGFVNEADAAILATNWQTTSGATWIMGDFNGDYAVNDIDATIMAANWQSGASGAVPEPGTLTLLTFGGLTLLGLVARRRKR